MELRVKKEKIIKEFQNELIVKGFEEKNVFSEPFLKVLNAVYKHSPKEMKCHISRLNTLTFLIIKSHTYIYLEWSINKKSLLSITDMNDFNNGGIYTLCLEEALEKIEKTCRTIKT